MRAAFMIAALVLTSCADLSTPSEAELERQAAELFKNKRVYKDPDSNLCLIVLQGEFANRYIFEPHVERCKSRDHVLKPAAE
jgi:hypothetical protein